MALDTRQVNVAINVFAKSEGFAEEIVEEALTTHGSVVGWRFVTTDGSSEEAQDTETGS